MTATEADRVARAGITGVCEPGDRATRERVAREGAEAVWGRLVAEGGADPEAPRRHLARLAKVGGRLVVPGDEEWPWPLDALDAADYLSHPHGEQHRAPLALWVRGTLPLSATADRAVAVVGSRAATPYGVRVASELAAGLAARDVVVVSGAAFGIDAAAHEGALAGEGQTVAVLAGGVDVAYPTAHAGLLEAVLAAGAVVSEVPPGSAPFRQRFLLRNRLIAGLSRATVLVEAGLRSGALNTAAHARAVHRPVLAVPGPVTSLLSAGCHEEVRSRGALLVTRAADVVAVALPLTSPVAAQAQAELPLAVQAPAGPRDGLRTEVARLLDAVPSRRPATVDRVAAVARVPVRIAMVELTCLEEAGLVCRVDGGWRLTDLGRRPAAAAGTPAARPPAAP